MREYTTERGVEIGVVPIPLLLEAIRQAHPMPAAPAYTEHLAGGAEQAVEITAEMARAWAADNPDGWREHAPAWAAYQAALAERTRALDDALWRAVMRKAIALEMPAGDGWIEEQQSYGIQVPDDPDERRRHYIRTEVIGGQRDVLRIMGLAAGADLTEEQLTAAEAAFWNSLPGPAAGRAARQRRAVAARAAGRVGADGQGVGEAAV